jgi:hypothetical protein
MIVFYVHLVVTVGFSQLKLILRLFVKVNTISPKIDY